MLVLVVLLAAWSASGAPPPAPGSTLQAPCPDMCRCDLASTPRRVDCSGLGLTVFPSSLHVSTQYLDLSYNQLKSLPPRLSQLLPQLETLVLLDNQIERLENDAFQGLQDLRTVDLSYNRLSGAPPDRLVATNPRVLELRLASNPGLQSTGHLSSPYLELLDLSACNVTRLEGAAFLGLPSLRTLNMSLNPLTILPVNITSNSLRILDLTQCKITSIPAYILTGMPKLQQLHIAKNPNLDLPKNPSLTSKSLLQLTADHCNVQHASITNLPALTHAYLSCNKITVLRRDNFARRSALLEIDLAQNLIRELPVDVFLNAKHLVSVDLSSNHIESLQYDSFSCCKELKFLNLTRNDITKLPDALTMPTLVVFDLSRCRLASLPSNPDFLNKMAGLNQLYLAHNEIQTVPNLVSKTLKVLDLSYCHLTHLTNQTFKQVNELQRLDLSGNRLTTLNADIFKDNNKLGTLNLDNNPWRCNCTDPEFQSLFELAEQLSETGRDQLKCNDPEEFAGKYWDVACKKPTSDGDSSNNWLLSLTLFLSLAALAGVMMCTKRLVGARQKSERRRHRRTRSERANQPHDSDSSDDEPRVARNRVESNTQCAPCSEGLRNQRRLLLAAEAQPPTYEEAVLMPAGVTTASISASNNDIDIDSNELNVDNDSLESDRNETSEEQSENTEVKVCTGVNGQQVNSGSDSSVSDGPSTSVTNHRENLGANNNQTDL